MVDPVDYHLLLKYPDRDEPENSDFTSFIGGITQGDVLSLPEKGGWRVEEVRAAPAYSHEAVDEAPTHAFMILLEPRLTPSGESREVALEDEHDRLIRLAIGALAAPGTSGP